jgi:uridine phosphorylase
VLIPGDPGRVDLIARLWDESEPLVFHREYKSARGRYHGTEIGSVSGGIGMGSTEIALQELAEIGVETVIKVGTTAALLPGIDRGDLIIPVAGMANDGTTRNYVPAEFPAFADPGVFAALVEACRRLGYRFHVGLVYSVGSFYLGQGRPVHGGFWRSGADSLIDDLRRMGVTNIEMEAAGVMVLGHLFRLRAGAVLAVVGNRATNEWGDQGGEERACRAACEAVSILAEWIRDGTDVLSVRRA